MKQKPLFLAILSGLLLSLSWYVPFQFLIFVALVPILFLEKYFFENKLATWKLYLYVFLAILIWNIGTIWWLWNATKEAAVAAYIANALLQSLPVLFFHLVKKNSQNRFGYWAFLLAWVAFEYLHLNWFLSWSWISLGNAFAYFPQTVQWYEFTGVLGGSAWVLGVNILAFYAISERKKYIELAFVFGLPLLISTILYVNYEEKGEKAEILVVQPNVDCYSEKYTYNSRTGEQNISTYIPLQKQVGQMTELIEKNISPKTQAVLLPETALHENIDEQNPQNDFGVSRLNALMKKYPQSALLVGVNALIFYKNQEDAKSQSTTYRKSSGVFYDIANAAYFNDNLHNQAFYHKSRLVIGVETNPFNGLFRYFGDDFMLNFGGAIGNLATQTEREVFAKNKLVLAPVICYESIFGEYVGEYMQKGGNLIAIITNDGWWDDTAGHRQHFQYARLRAVETRKSVARAANTGISGFINQRGDVLVASKYDEINAIRHEIQLNDELTFYARYGDFLGRLAAFLFVFMFLAAWVRKKAVR